MVYRKTPFILLIFMLFFSACTSNKEITKPYILPYSATKESSLFMYNLPATMLEIEVTVKHTQYFKGPYADYTKRFLGIDQNKAVQKNHSNFRITAVKINTIPVNDFSQWYVYIPNLEQTPSFSLTEENFLAGLNKKIPQPNLSKANTLNNHPSTSLDYLFADLGIDKYSDKITQTSYKQVKMDTAVVRVPVQETVTKTKNEEELARSAADFINKIKNSRFELVAGLYEVFPEGRSLEASIKEMYALENRYMELFLGKTTDTTCSYIFHVTPESNIATPFMENLCLFDPKTGVTLLKKEETKIENPQALQIIIDYAAIHPLNNQRISHGGPAYRVPMLCDVEVICNQETLQKTKININQLGYVYQLPIEVLQKQFEIEFNPETGNLRNLTLPPTPNKKKRDKR